MTELGKLPKRSPANNSIGFSTDRDQSPAKQESHDGEPTLGPITVRVPKAVALTGLSRTKLYELIKAKEIEVIKVGSSTLIVVASLHQFVDRRRS